MPTISVENYLKAIYHLAQRAEDGRVKTKALADHLELSLPSVTSMLKSLGDEGLVDYRRYRGANLTPRGRLEALNVIRKHRLIEQFLVTTLGYSWDEVHAEAERLEHAISDELAARIEHFLAYPRFDPHGDPIPDAQGRLPEREIIPLDQAAVGVALRIDRVTDQDPELLRYLKRLGLTPQARCVILDVVGYDGQVTLQLDELPAATISHAVASRLMVKVLAAPSA